MRELGFRHVKFEMSGHPSGEVKSAGEYKFTGISPGWRYKCRNHLYAVDPSKSLSLSGLETWSPIMPWGLSSGKA